ncbi:MAG: 50S ribosomal protein L17 [Candidatus Magasanikbacteria bacterium]|nr:50S ribosomal protein L17 [Candidatus Magasanikbacteria bacterium]
MRHRKRKVTLDRQSAPRRALLRGLAEQVILWERVQTTLAKAKAVRPLVERLVSRAKEATLANRRYLLSALYTRGAVNKLLEVLGPRYRARPGGYTRLTLVGERRGDGSKIAVIEFV